MSRARTARLLLSLLAVAGVVSLPSASAAGPKTYVAPFAVGPVGGDTYSRTVAQPDGRVVVGRVYVVPGAISCPAGAPFANLRVTHPVTEPVREVKVDLDQGAVDPYSFVRIGVRDQAGNWLGSGQLRGPVTGASSLIAKLAWPARVEDAPTSLTIDFGLQASGACPSTSFGEAMFTKVSVVPASAPQTPPPPPSGGGGPGAPVQFLTVPQGSLTGYVTPAVVMPKGGTGTYTNADIVRHDVVQDVAVDGKAGPDTNPWCNRFAVGKCPMFWTPLIGVTEQAPVQGLSALASGQYSFFCTLHPSMKGKLVVQ